MRLKNLALVALVSVVALTASTHAKQYVGFDVGRVHLDPKGNFNDALNEGRAYETHKTKAATTLNILYGCESVKENGLSLGWELTAGTSFSGTDEPVDADGLGGTDDRAMKIRQHWKVGGYGLVGKPLSNKVTLYGKLGLVLSKFKGQGFTDTDILEQPIEIIRRSHYLFGVEPGVRLKVDMTDSLSAKFDVNCALYGRSKKANYADTEDINEAWDFRLAPRMFGVTAGLCWKIN